MPHCRYFVAMVLVVAVAFSSNVQTTAAQTKPAEGIRQHTPQVYALTGARIVVAPGRVLESATLVIRHGAVAAVGEKVDPPADARVIDLAGRTIYPGLIDAYSEVKVDTDALQGGAPHWNQHVWPQRSVASSFQPDAALNKKLRNVGIVARLVAPADEIIRGTSAVITTGDTDGKSTIIAADVAQHLRLTIDRKWGKKTYPNSPMGAVALARQTLLDARWYADAWKAYQANPQLPKPDRDDALAILSGQLDESLFLLTADHELQLLRSDRFAREFNLNAAIVGSGDEYRRLDAVKETGRTIIVPVNFPIAPNVATEEAALNVTLESLLDWDLAPENPARLHSAGVTIALTGHGLKEPSKFRAQVRTAVARGLPEDAALAALTTTPAKLYGVDARYGTLNVGRSASLVVTDGPLFAEKTKIIETWVDGKRHTVVSSPQHDLTGEWTLTAKQKGLPPLKLTISGTTTKPQLTLSAKKKQAKVQHVDLTGSTLTGTFAADDFGHTGVARLSLVVAAGNDSQRQMQGTVTLPDGDVLSATATPAAEKPRKKNKNKQKENAAARGQNEPAKADAKATPTAATFEVNYPLGAFGVTQFSPPPKHVLFKNATIWTCGKQGILTDADLLITAGKIAAVGRNLDAPKDAKIVDCTGKQLTPGIIDCHSHMASDSGINESTQSVTAEVRIGDLIDCDDIDIYRQLAGGVTTANILHGSANTIGGQNQVIQLKWGRLDEELKFAAAPAGIKFALGENVKQSNWGDEHTTRYPQTRMGVEQIILDEFAAARAYQEDWQRWRTTRQGLPPRTNLQLEAISEILQGKRWIHCHSYRQDEILALIRVLDLYDVKIGSFQHILEGYKVATEMQAHGATGSTFSDWWAYKIEVYDAIPYNGAIMQGEGIPVSFNSDDQELARHLNQEAAKAVKYGGVPREEALKFVTLNPAKQLRIDHLVGSLEVGKQADVAVWSADPLSILARCEQTWIAGQQYFDIEDDAQRRAQTKTMRATLIQKILTSGVAMAKETDPPAKGNAWLWPREDIFCGARRRVLDR